MNIFKPQPPSGVSYDHAVRTIDAVGTQAATLDRIWMAPIFR